MEDKNNKIMKLTEHMIVPRRRGNRGSLVLGLLLLGAGYWTVGQGIVMYHKAVRQFVQYAIANDIAQTGLSKAELTDRAMYSTAVKLDSCLASIDAVRESIAPLPLGGPSTTPTN